MKIWMRWRFAALAMAAGVFACGDSGGDVPAEGESAQTDGAQTDGTFTIALIAKSSTNPVFLAARSGAEAAARELSGEYGVDIRIAWLTPPQEDGQVQAQRIYQAVNDGANAILMSSSDAAKVMGAINDAAARGVPVMTFDSDVPQSERFAFYGVDDLETGRSVMRELAELMDGEGSVAILAGNQNAPNLQKRAQGVREEAENYPGIEIVSTFNHNETPQDAAAEVIRVMNAYPEITGWAMIGGWALFTRTLLTDLDPARVKVVSVDALPQQLAYVEQGIAPVLLAQPVYQWGYVGVETIMDRVYRGEEGPEMLPMELVRVTEENVGDWARQLHDWGISGVPASYLEGAEGETAVP